MPGEVTLTEAEAKELRELIQDVSDNPFAGGEIRAMGGLRSVLSREIIDKLGLRAPENKGAEALRSLR